MDHVGPAEQLEIVERNVPSPGPDEVSIDVAYAGVGLVDVLFRSGALPLATPFVPGIEVTGHVRDVGPHVDDLRPGQPVAALLNDFGRTQRAGGYAQVSVAHRTMVAPLTATSDLPVVTGALVNGVTGWLALREVARVQPQETVVVLGASGGLGGTTARIAALLPCRRVIGVVSGEPHRAPEQCTDVVLTDDLERWVAADTGGVDVVIDPVGGRSRELMWAGLAPFGRHVVLGNASGRDVPVSSDQAWHATATMTGLSIGAVAHLRPDAVQSALTAIISLIDRGLLAGPAPDVHPLTHVVEVHRALENRTAPAKTVLDAAE